MRGVPFDSAQGTPLEIIESMWDSTYFDSARTSRSPTRSAKFLIA
jgi:hypothetical protein